MGITRSVCVWKPSDCDRDHKRLLSLYHTDLVPMIGWVSPSFLRMGIPEMALRHGYIVSTPYRDLARRASLISPKAPSAPILFE